MTKVTKKPQQSKRVAMRFASRMKGRKKTLCQWRYRGSVKARKMTMRVRRPLQGTLRKKIQSYDTQSKKVKKTRKPNCFFSVPVHKLNQSKKRYRDMRQSQRRRQNQKRR
ncbi:hypothetical protein JEQ12_020308 [Ovis aries]|uniref:Spermatid nuclear transition protein 3-like n=1 Tax=Ovis aries TaxID=9940 RepID=A0A836CPD7_SHEEP|nr:hypothetical protein JEQ12_020308 [Ovis aries]